MAPVVKALEATEGINVGVYVTAQHRGMLDQVLSLFDIVPDYDLDVMRNNQDLTHITCAVLDGLGAVLDEFKPDRVRGLSTAIRRPRSQPPWRPFTSTSRLAMSRPDYGPAMSMHRGPRK